MPPPSGLAIINMVVNAILGIRYFVIHFSVATPFFETQLVNVI